MTSTPRFACPRQLPWAQPLARACVIACAMTCGLAPALTARAEPGDAMLQLLKERGLLPSDAAAAAASGIALTSATSATSAPTVVQQLRDAASDAVLAAMNFIGTPYRRGGSTAEQGFDCSGFTRHVFELSLGRVLPRRADEQARDRELLTVDRSELRPGDLVFFNTLKRAFSHVGIYIGDGRFIHAPRSGASVRIEDMRAAYWARRYNGARRADLPAATGGPEFIDAAR